VCVCVREREREKERAKKFERKTPTKICRSLEFQIWLQNLFLAEKSRFGFLAKLGLQASAWPHLFLFVCLFVLNLFLCVCVCVCVFYFYFLSFWFLFIADVLLLFEVVVSQRRIVLFLNLVWELRRGGGGCLDPWKCRSRKKKKRLGWR
jgi:hypothetical protein